MANVKFFCDCQGFTAELLFVQHDMKGTKPANFYGKCPRCHMSHKATRRVEYKAFPSRHRCDARCEGARGHNCECSCGGRNHGKGFAAVMTATTALPLFAAAF